MNMEQNLKHYLRAGYPALYIQTPEEGRVEAAYTKIINDLNSRASDVDERSLFTFDMFEGLVNLLEPGGNGSTDPLDVLQKIGEMKTGTVVLLNDFHAFIEGGGTEFVLHFKRCIRKCKSKGNQVVVVGCRKVIPPEIEREITFLEFELPERAELKTVADGISKSAKIPLQGEDLELVVSSLQGLTLNEAEDALALSLIKNQKFVPRDIAMEKANQVKKSGLLEIVSSDVSIDDIGGLEEVKRWARSIAKSFSFESKQYSKDRVKGVLNLGLPGTGKSLFAVALGNIFRLTVLKCDAGKIFGSLVGESESNVRQIIMTAEAMSPCILWIDEIDKGLGSAANSAVSGDSGTSDRVLSTILTWMQEKKKEVFVVATANDPKRLAASDGALIRKGRFDEMFFHDLPHEQEREAIIRIHLDGRKRDSLLARSPIISVDDFDIDTLVDASDGFTGAEIESAIIAAIRTGDMEGKETITDLDLIAEFGNSVPLSQSMKTSIDETRRWAKANCRFASTPPPTKELDAKGRKLDV